jgi:hypothetical protein
VFLSRVPAQEFYSRQGDQGLCYPTLPQKNAEGWGTHFLEGGLEMGGTVRSA